MEYVCREREIPCYSFHVDLKRFARKEGMSQEEAGRYYRYQCFEKVRKEVGAQRIAVAHQQEDVRETILFNLFRGTGLKGLTGIPPVRDVIIRPMLCVGRADIEKYLVERGISWRTDETNLTDDYTRNKIRNQVLPYVEEHINPAAGQHIQEMAGLMRDISNYLDRQAEEAFDGISRLQLCIVFKVQHSLIGPVFKPDTGIDSDAVNSWGAVVGDFCCVPYMAKALKNWMWSYRGRLCGVP